MSATYVDRWKTDFLEWSYSTTEEQQADFALPCNLLERLQRICVKHDKKQKQKQKQKQKKKEQKNVETIETAQIVLEEELTCDCCGCDVGLSCYFVEGDDDADIIIREYPFWLIRDWYFIYDEFVSSYFNQTSIQWNSLPSLYLGHGEITPDLFEQVYEGMAETLYYRHDQNTVFHRTFPGAQINFYELTEYYVSYLYQKL